jgi:hypothetical protein
MTVWLVEPNHDIPTRYIPRNRATVSRFALNSNVRISKNTTGERRGSVDENPA